MFVIVGQFFYNLVWAWAMANYRNGDLAAYSLLMMAEANMHRAISCVNLFLEYKEVTLSWLQR